MFVNHIKSILEKETKSQYLLHLKACSNIFFSHFSISLCSAARSRVLKLGRRLYMNFYKELFQDIRNPMYKYEDPPTFKKYNGGDWFLKSVIWHTFQKLLQDDIANWARRYNVNAIACIVVMPRNLIPVLDCILQWIFLKENIYCE